MKHTITTITIIMLAGAARAQEAMETAAATITSPGAFTLRPSVHWERFGSNPVGDLEEKTERTELMTRFIYGVVRNWALQVDLRAGFKEETFADGRTDSDQGVEDIHIELKHRFYKEDSSPIDTTMAAVFFGAGVASGDDSDFSSQSVNPHVGGVVSVVRGKWGFNQELAFTLNTGGDADDNLGGEGPADMLHFNTAGVYRIWPDEFSSDSTGGWYVTAEALGMYETNGDTEIRFGPGVMYEGRKVSFEAMVLLPMYDDVDRRAEYDIGVGAGLRISF